MNRLLPVLVALLAAPTAGAAPEGFRLSGPLTTRAAAVGANPAVTVHCARSPLIWIETATSEAAASAYGRTNLVTREIMLPPLTCVNLERWLRSKPVDLALLAHSLFTLAHEIAHAGPGIRDERRADCWATRKYNTVARAFGVKRVTMLQRLRDEAPLYNC